MTMLNIIISKGPSSNMSHTLASPLGSKSMAPIGRPIDWYLGSTEHLLDGPMGSRIQLSGGAMVSVIHGTYPPAHRLVGSLHLYVGPIG
jgi:hypothetical protein